VSLVILVENAYSIIQRASLIVIFFNFGWTKLHYVAYFGHGHEIERRLAKGDAIGALEGGSWTLLHVAVIAGNSETARVLIEHGALQTADKYGWTPLHFAMLDPMYLSELYWYTSNWDNADYRKKYASVLSDKLKERILSRFIRQRSGKSERRPDHPRRCR
jgi:hypothetical protein